MADKKHVIILGAGASKTSGYPLADDLRRLLSSKEALYEFARKVMPCSSGDLPPEAKTIIDKVFNRAEQSVQAFRRGSFGTVDEFCKLVQGGKLPDPAEHMKTLLRLVLLIHEPEEHFKKSDYYPFIQRLFESNLSALRKDLRVLTLNYDPYMEFLLCRACITRSDLKGNQERPDPDFFNSITGGFYCVDRRDWVAKGFKNKNFCVLKLHGSAYSSSNYMPFERLFDAGPLDRLKQCEYQESNSHPSTFHGKFIPVALRGTPVCGNLCEVFGTGQ